jgi:hypothetical protein
MRLDSKVHGTIIKNKDGRVIPEDEFVVFRPHDNSFLPTLEFYRQQLIRDGAEQGQLDAVDALVERVRVWRSAHPERCKVADVEPGEI